MRKPHMPCNSLIIPLYAYNPLIYNSRIISLRASNTFPCCLKEQRRSDSHRPVIAIKANMFYPTYQGNQPYVLYLRGHTELILLQAPIVPLSTGLNNKYRPLKKT